MILERHCDSHNYMLVATFEEIDVSGYTLQELHQRKRGLAPAVAMIERGEADVLLLPWLDRIARNLTLFRNVRKRIQSAGGSIEAIDFGVVTGGTAAQRFSAETLIHVAEFFAELTAEKTEGAQKSAIDAGIPTFNNIPYGYRKDPVTRRLVVDEDEARVVKKAFAMREAGAMLETIRDYMRSQGAPHSIRRVQGMLRSRIYLGELHFGEMSNVHSHQLIIDPGTWRTVQGMRVSRAAHTPSERLLARLGIVRCKYCKRALVVGGQVKYRGRGAEKKAVRYVDYRCSSMGDCTERVAISADFLEEAVAVYVKQADAEGHASIDEQIEVAEQEYQQVETTLNTFVKMFTGLGDLTATQEKLAELKANREEAYERWQTLRTARGTAGVRASDWDVLTFAERRALIRSTIRRIDISRGIRGTYAEDRIRIEPFRQ